ncbi:MAG: hypothetical protein NVS2B8_12040 [Vulcanimicrobiaceae bacterium]
MMITNSGASAKIVANDRAPASVGERSSSHAPSDDRSAVMKELRIAAVVPVRGRLNLDEGGKRRLSKRTRHESARQSYPKRIRPLDG